MRKPPKNTRCDATIGYELGRGGEPLLIRCSNMATQTIRVMFETWVCDGCAEALKEKYLKKSSK
jgi:hypothetical protein